MGKLKLELDNAPEGVGSKQLFDDKNHMEETIDTWKESGKMKNVTLKGSVLTYETNGEKGKGVVKEVGDDFEFKEESED